MMFVGESGFECQIQYDSSHPILERFIWIFKVFLNVFKRNKVTVFDLLVTNLEKIMFEICDLSFIAILIFKANGCYFFFFFHKVLFNNQRDWFYGITQVKVIVGALDRGEDRVFRPD